jgi:hypothetical protein
MRRSSLLCLSFLAILAASCATPNPGFLPQPEAQRGSNVIFITTDDEPAAAIARLTDLLEEDGFRVTRVDQLNSALTALRRMERGDDVTVRAAVRRSEKTEIAMLGEITRGLDGIPRRLEMTNRPDDGFSHLRLLAERYPGAELRFARSH